MFKNTYIFAFLTLLYFPIAVLVMNSFNLSIYDNCWEGFTLYWYKNLKDNTHLVQAAKNSLFIACISSCISSVLGIFTSFLIYKYKFPGKKFLFFSIQSMIVVPDIIFATSLLMFFMLTNIKLGFLTILFSHTALSFPFVFFIIFLGCNKIESNVLEVAKDLGASDWQVFIKIFLPLLSPNILAAYLVAFAISFDDVTVSSFVNSPSYELLPLKIVSLLKLSVKPEINAMCVVIFLISIFPILLTHFLIKEKLYV